MPDVRRFDDAPRSPEPGAEKPFRLAVVGTPRSGNTWLRHLLAWVFDLPELGFPYPEDVDWASLPNRCILQIHGGPDPAFRAMLDRHGVRPVVPARHPLDVLMSLLSFATQRHDPGLPGGDIAEVERPIVGAFPRDPAVLAYASRLGDSDISARWWPVAGVPRVRYEDLRADTPGELARLVAEIGEAPARPVAEAVAAGRMDAMRTTFRAWPHHFFQGRPGLWRSVLPAADARRLFEAQRPIFEALGYEVDPDEGLDPREADLNWARLLIDADRRFIADGRASLRDLRADFDHERRGHDQTREAYANALRQVHELGQLLYDERVSSTLIRRDADHWRARAEAAEESARRPAPGRLARGVGRIVGRLFRPGAAGSLTGAGGAIRVAAEAISVREVDASSTGRSPHHGPPRHPLHRPVGRPEP